MDFRRTLWIRCMSDLQKNIIRFLQDNKGHWFYVSQIRNNLNEEGNTNFHSSINALVRRGLIIKRVMGKYFQFTISDSETFSFS